MQQSMYLAQLWYWKLVMATQTHVLIESCYVHGMGQNASCTLGDCLTFRAWPEGRFQPRELWLRSGSMELGSFNSVPVGEENV